MKWSTLLALSLAIGCLGPDRGAAQEITNLRGRVVDVGSGAPLRGAQVLVEGPQERSVLSGQDGRWTIVSLPPGAYRVRVRQIGFAERSLVIEIPRGDGDLSIGLTPVALPLDALVVSASRRMQRLADTPVTIEVIGRADIERARVSDLSTLLVEQVGIQLEGGHPAGEGVMLQGLGSERVLILLDGQPMVGRISGQIDLSRIPTSMVEQVEVMKGPQSSLYGSEAMGGVVNIITRSGSSERWDASLDVTGGTQSRADVSGVVRGTVGGLQYLVDAGRRTTKLTPGMADERGALAERYDGLVKLAWAPDSAFNVEANVILLDERQRWQGGTLYNFADNRQTNIRLGAEWHRGAHRLAPTLYATEFGHLSRRATAGDPVAGSGDQESQRLFEGELIYNLALGRSRLDVGVEAKREEIASDRVVGRDRGLYSVEPFAQMSVALGSLNLVPGGRFSWSEQWGTHLTPSLAALYRPVPSLALRASVGRGFRAPDFKELYMEFLNVGAGFGYTVRGNPDVTPETSTNFSGGVEWVASRAFLRGQLFHNRFEDFIETQLVGDSTGLSVFTYGNISAGKTRGFDLEGGLNQGRLRTEIGYGYLEAHDSGTGQPLLGRPAHSGRMLVEYALPLDLRAAVSGVYTGTAPLSRDEAGVVVMRDGFARFDLRLAHSFPAGLELSLGARNVFDAQPEGWPGFSGRHLYIGVGWQGRQAISP